MNPDDLAIAFEIQSLKRRAEPLRYWKASSEPQDYMIRQFLSGNWVLGQGGNRSGKSEGIGAAVCALSRGIGEIGGYSAPITVPVLEPPVIGVLSGESYKALSIGAIETVRRLFGDRENWKEEHAGSPDAVSLFRVKHERARDESDWSRIYVFPYDGALPEGPGLDFWWTDEPPPARFLTALRSRIRAGRMLRQATTMTPREKSKWVHIREQFPKVLREVENQRVRVQWPSFVNEALSDADRKKLESNALGDMFERAILYGDFVDVVGGNPWPEDKLREALARTRPPMDVEKIRVEKQSGGEAISADLQVWEKPNPGEPYYIVGDPAKGIHDGKHDPDGMHVRSRRTRKLVARLSGYLGGWGLGNAMAEVGKRYNEAICDPLTTGGYGEAVIQALRARGYRRFARSRIETRPGEWEERIGTTETHALRGKIIGAVEREILSGLMDCPSAEVIECLMDCTVDKDGKVLAAPGSHDEDLICWGRGCLYLDQWGVHSDMIPAEKPRVDAMTRWKELRNEADTALIRQHGITLSVRAMESRYEENVVEP